MINDFLEAFACLSAPCPLPESKAVSAGAGMLVDSMRKEAGDLQNALPDILCVVQVALEGAISKEAALQSLAKGTLPSVSLTST